MRRLLAVTMLAAIFSGCATASRSNATPTISQLKKSKFPRCMFVHRGGSRGIRLETGGMISYEIIGAGGLEAPIEDLAAQFISSGACAKFTEER